MGKSIHALLVCSLFAACCLAQTPTLKVLPWNGHSAAVSLTFDDARPVHSDVVVMSTAQAAPVCYTCFFQNSGIQPDAELTPFFKFEFKTADPLVAGDARFILWRATGKRDCGALDVYRGVTGDPDRRLIASADVGFSAWECDQDGSVALEQASKLAASIKRHSESRALHELSTGTFDPKFNDTAIRASLVVPPSAKSMVLGESTIKLTPGMRVGTQVERVYRDWLSYVLPWDMTRNPVALPLVRDYYNYRPYHEGAVIADIQRMADVQVTPLSGTLIARNADGKWYGPDEKGVFRFEILDDKVEYPTTHTFGNFAWIVDTHGISALVSQALEYRSQLVVGCGDSEGKAKAAYYLAQKGVDVVTPGDRYQYLLIGYKGKGTLMGTAPIKRVDGIPVIGQQPIKFSLAELIVAEDTAQRYPWQYYDAAARYFRQLSKFVPLNVKYVVVDSENQIGRVLAQADSVVAVRVRTETEDVELRRWLRKSPMHRAILFHSGLYPPAQALFADFPNQVTFGDLRPRFQ
jgi:hypothetical protein